MERALHCRPEPTTHVRNRQVCALNEESRIPGFSASDVSAKVRVSSSDAGLQRGKAVFLQALAVLEDVLVPNRMTSVHLVTCDFRCGQISDCFSL